MDALETLTAATSFKDELAFFQFARRNRRVHIISPQASLDGPVFLSVDDLVRLRRSSSPDDHTVLLWNAELADPLCWGLYLSYYDVTWQPVVWDHPSAHKQPKTTSDFLALHGSLRTTPIAQNLFAHGHYDRVLSPVMDISLPSVDGGDFMITADFCNWVYQDVWIVWDAYADRWVYETRDLDRLADERFEKSPDFIHWQETLFAWMRANWADKIDLYETYRL